MNMKNRVSLTLQYNDKNSNETLGKMIRLSYPEKIDEERRCLQEVFRYSNDKVDAKERQRQNTSDWFFLAPR